MCTVPLPRQQYRYLDIKSDELKGTFKSDAESEQRLLYYGQLDRMRHVSLEPSAPQVTHHRQVDDSSTAAMLNTDYVQPEWYWLSWKRWYRDVPGHHLLFRLKQKGYGEQRRMKECTEALGHELVQTCVLAH